MKKILIIIFILLIIPFTIVTLFDSVKEEEINLLYVDNNIIRVKRNKSGKIDSIPLEEYIVGVLAGEMPIYFEKEALKAQAVAARSKENN